MNTEKYLKFFGDLAEKGEIPRDVYDTVLAEIARDGGRMTKRVYAVYLRELEKRRLFLADGAPFDTRNSAKTDGSYVYIKKNPIGRTAHAFWSTLFKIIGFGAGALLFGVWRVKDKKKLKGIKACITTSNHIGFLDAVLTRRAAGGKKQYIIAAPHNCKNNIGGAILRAATVLPLPSGLRGMKPFEEALEYLKERKAKLHFYAEQSMWIGYKKPRPHRDGAYFYADRLDLPVVPMLYCYGKPNPIRRLLHLPKMVIRIGDPIYIDRDLPPRERKTDMAKRAYAATKELYEDFYGIPLEYEDLSEAEQACDAT